MTIHFPEALCWRSAMRRGLLVFAVATAWWLATAHPSFAESGCSFNEKARIGITCDKWRAELLGRMHIDYLSFSRDDDADALEDPISKGRAAAGIRRVRLGIKGGYGTYLGYKFEYDFVSSTGVKDAYMDITFDAFKIRLGHFKMPFSLSEMTSSRFYPFLERPLTDDNVAMPGRKMGIGVFTKGSMWTWGTAIHSDGYREDTNREKSLFGFSTRITYAPWHESTLGNYLHLGLGWRLASVERNPAQQDFDGHTPFTSAVLKDDIYSVKGLNLDRYHVINPELAYGFRSLGVQAEYWRLTSSAPVAANELDMNAYYVQATFWITGERNAYKDGAFKRIKPARSFGQGGIGAFAVSARFQSTSYEVGEANDDRVRAITFGVQWKPDPYVKLSLEYALATRKIVGQPDDKPSGLQARLGIDW
ncbi:MAG: hypothetical protein GDA54_04245 [Alphaproteobacteria bacterium GM7ARS4]|nr:hypothetical protein [Alphaproteobacteria bacterium GM7ARS4]